MKFDDIIFQCTENPQYHNFCFQYVVIGGGIGVHNIKVLISCDFLNNLKQQQTTMNYNRFDKWLAIYVIVMKSLMR